MRRCGRQLVRGAALSLVLLAAVACGGGGDSPMSPTPTPAGPPVDTTTITIGSSGAVSPATIRVPAGSRVTIVNNDSVGHDMNSDPHPEHGDCPALNWGPLQSGQSRQSGVLSSARTCGYHDHDRPTTASLQGQVVVQ